MLNPEAAEVVFVYEGQDTPVVEQEVTVGDERQKVAITVEKQDAENSAVVAGAVFGIYNKEDITADGKVIVAADTLLPGNDFRMRRGRQAVHWIFRLEATM